MTREDTVISLFSGAGGMSLGFSQAGLKPVIAADLDLDACHTYQNNLGIEPFNIDLSENDTKFPRVVAEFDKPFAVIGGPPCQGFSSAGQKNGGDKRNELIFQYLWLVERIRPRWFLFENVEGLLTSNNGQSVTDLVREFIKLGYRVCLEKINFASFGLPQGRKRVLLMGNRIGIDFAFPPPTHSFNAGKHKSRSFLPQSPTLDEALAGLGCTVKRLSEISRYATGEPVSSYDALMRQGNASGGVYLHCSSISESFVETFKKLRPGETMKNLSTEYWHSSYKKRAFRRVMDGTPTEKRGGAPSGIKRLFGNLNALTITSAATREFIHPYENRPLTLREAARLQSFPDQYSFTGTSTSIARQIGNAFPPLAARVLAEHLLMLDGSQGADQRNGHFESDGALIGYHLTDAPGMSPALTRTDTLLTALMATYDQSALPFEAA